MTKLKRKQYCWKIDEHAKGYSCVFLYVRQNEKLTHDEEVRLDLDNPNAAISFHKLLIEAGYKYKQIEIVTTPEWAA
jgi:hypothetical protein